MKKSNQVPASLIVALAGLSGAGLTVAGCGSSGYDECVDATGRIVPDTACHSGSTYAGAHYIHRGGFGGSGSSGGFFGG